MNDTKNVVPFLAKLKTFEQTPLFLEHYQTGTTRLVAISKTKGLIAGHADADFIERHKTANIYYPFNQIDESFRGIKAKKTDIVGLRGWCADLDPVPGNEAEPNPDIFRQYHMLSALQAKDGTLLRQQAYLLQEIIHPIFLGQRGLQPTLGVWSGRGFQLLWYADKIYPVQGAGDIDHWESIGRALVSVVGGDAVYNVDRILRLPGTLNLKTGATARVVWETHARHTPEAMAAAYGTADPGLAPEKQGVDPTRFKYVEWDVVFGVQEILDLDDVLVERFERDRRNNTELAAIYAGDPVPGQRDTSGSGFDLMLIGRLKRLGYEPQEAFELAMTCEHGAGQKYARRKDRRHFMRCWSRSPGEEATTPEEDFIDIPAEQLLSGKPVFTERNAARAHQQITEQYRYVAADDMVIHVQTGEWFRKTGFDLKFCTTHPGLKDTPPKAHKVLITSGRQVDKATWLPGRAREFTEHGLNYYNLYSPPRRPVVDYKPGCTAIAHEALEWVVPNAVQRETLLDHFAYTVQHPDRKINFHPLLYSETEGVGKDTVLAIVRHAVGPHNTSETSIRDLTGAFNATLKYKKVIIINELQSFERGKEIANHLKTLLAAPPEFVEINAKFQPQFQQPNLFSVYMTSNSLRPIHLSKVDRRMVPIHCREKQMPEKLARKVWEWYQSGGLNLMQYELMHRDLTHFNPAVRPTTAELMTDHLDMQHRSMSHSEVMVETAIDEGLDVFARDVVLASQLHEFAKMHGNMNVQTISEALQSAGAQQIYRATVRLDGKPRKITMWIVRNVSDYVFVEDGQVRFQDGVSARTLYDIAKGLTDFNDNDEDEDIL